MGNALKRKEMEKSFEELDRYYRIDPWAYYAGVVKIKPKVGDLVAFRALPAQRHVHELLEKQKRDTGKVRALILKGRQMGISTYVAARFFRGSTFAPGMGTRTYIMTHEGAATANLFGMAKRMHDYSPPDFKHTLRASNANELEFDGLESGYRVGTAGAAATGRSLTVQQFHGSELGFWPNAEDHLAGVMETIPDANGTEVLLESTANGVGGVFYDMWQVAEAGKSDFQAIFCPWFWEEKYRKGLPDGYAPSAEEVEYGDLHGLDREQVCWMHYKNINQNGKPGILGWKFKQEYPSCIAGDMKVGTEDGILDMDSVRGGMVCDQGTIRDQWTNGERRVVTVTTSLGYQITCTPDHLFLRSAGEYREASGLTGTEVVLQPPPFSTLIVHTVVWAPFPGVESRIQITPMWARFLGYFAGDGSFYKGTISIVCDAKDRDVIDDVKGLFSTLIGDANERVVGSKDGGVEVRLERRAMKDVLMALGVLKRIPNRGMKRKVCVPDGIWRSPKRIVREFLRGLFEADGFAGYGTAKVSLFSKHLSLLRDVQILLLGFGITSRLSSKPAKNGQGFEYIANTLTLRTEESIMFAKEVGFVSSRKNGRAAWKPRKLGKNALPLKFSDEVVSVEDAGICEVFDLEINAPGEPRFNANGFAVHNCAQEAFQTSGEDSLIDPNIVMRCRKTDPQPLEENPAPLVLGVDIGGGSDGGDETRILSRRGRDYGQDVDEVVKKTNNLEYQMKVVDRVAHLINTLSPRAVYIDVTGIGAGAVARLVQLEYDCVKAVNFGSSPSNDKLYPNKRSEIWCRLRDHLEDPGGASVPDNDMVHRHLCAPGYTDDHNSRTVLEKKKDIRKRLKLSPDWGDAAALTHTEVLPAMTRAAKKKSWRDDLNRTKRGRGRRSWMST